MTELVETVRLLVVKPVDITWDELGSTLRALRAPIHRVLNRTITDLEVREREGRYAPGNAQGPRGKDLMPRTDAYRLVNEHWAAERESARAAAEKAAKARKRAKKEGESNLDERIAALEPGSQVVNGCKDVAYTRWSVWRKAKWKGESSLPTFRQNSPIYIASSKAVQLLSVEGNLILDLGLLGGHGNRIRLYVKPSDTRGSGWAAIRRMLADPSSVGTCKLVESTKGTGDKKTWQALVSRRFEAPTIAEGRTMAVHRGVHNFLTAAINGDHREAVTRCVATGEDINRHKDIYAARRSELGRHLRPQELGRGAKGHGRRRRRECVDKLQDAESRWVKTKCQQIAAETVKLAKRYGVSRILVEEWGNPAAGPGEKSHVEYFVARFPLAQLRDCLIWAATKQGLTVDLVDGSYESRDCPACGHRHEDPPLGRDRSGRLSVFQCSNCRLERNVDQIAAWNLLVRAGYASPHIDAKRALKRAQGRLSASRG